MNFIHRLKINKRNSIIQVAGLVLGIVTCIIVGQNVIFEYSFDSFHKDKQKIYRTNGTEGRLLGPIAREHINYVENSARMHPCYRGVTVIAETNSFNEKRAYFADGALFDILSFPVVEGNAIEGLQKKNNMVISQRYAKKFFGNESPVGKTLLINGAYESNITYTVAGVFKDIPQNSHVKFDIILSIENILIHSMYTKDDPWRWKNFFTYCKTKYPVEASQFTTDLTQLALNNGMDQNPQETRNCPVSLLTDIHFNGQNNFMDNNPTTRYVVTQTVIALVVLFIAWLNFIMIGIGNTLRNLQSTNVRKILGASPLAIWFGLFQKSLVQNLAALFISALLFIFIQKITDIGYFSVASGSWRFIFWSIIVSLQIIGALIISLTIHVFFTRSKIRASLTQKEKLNNMRNSPWAGLFVLQFAASIVLISFSLFTFKQVDYIMHIDNGIQTEQILAIHSANYSHKGNIENDRQVFEEEALKIPGVTESTSAS